MKTFDYFDKRGPALRKTYQINDAMYDRLQYLASNVYQASVNKLIDAAIKRLIADRNVTLYSVQGTPPTSKRAVYMSEETYLGLSDLSREFGVSLTKLVDVAIHNALLEYKDYFSDMEGE